MPNINIDISLDEALFGQDLWEVLNWFAMNTKDEKKFVTSLREYAAEYDDEYPPELEKK